MGDFGLRRQGNLARREARAVSCANMKEDRSRDDRDEVGMPVPQKQRRRYEWALEGLLVRELAITCEDLKVDKTSL